MLKYAEITNQSRKAAAFRGGGALVGLLAAGAMLAAAAPAAAQTQQQLNAAVVPQVAATTVGAVAQMTQSQIRLALNRRRVADNGGDHLADATTLWGRRYAQDLDFVSENTDFRGNIVGAMAGADALLLGGNLLLGIAANESSADLDYRPVPPAAGRALGGAVGTHSIELSGFRPYVGLRTNDGFRMWGTLGIERGEIAITTVADASPATAPAASAPQDVELQSLSLGGYGPLYRGGGEGWHTNAGFFGTGAYASMQGTDADTFAVDSGRLRFGMEVDHSRPTGAAGTVSATFDVSLRRDLGDGLNGSGFELGGNIGWYGPGLRLDLSGRTLLAHSDETLEESGLSGAVSWSSTGGERFILAYSRTDDSPFDGTPFNDSSRPDNAAAMRLQYNMPLARDGAGLVLSAHDRGIAAGYRFGDSFAAGYSRYAAGSGDHRGYLRYQLRF